MSTLRARGCVCIAGCSIYSERVREELWVYKEEERKERARGWYAGIKVICE